MKVQGFMGFMRSGSGVHAFSVRFNGSLIAGRAALNHPNSEPNS